VIEMTVDPGEMGDKNWKWGVFYVNPDDPKVWVPKRYGVGYTLNFGNPWSWMALALILVAVVAPLSIPIMMLHAIKHQYLGR
jgi:uncharacterized membrane protein